MHYTIDSPNDSESDEHTDVIYDLYAVCVHSGYSASSGHYYSYCKNVSGKWSECNDSFISSSTESEALNQEAYLLFYQ